MRRSESWEPDPQSAIEMSVPDLIPPLVRFYGPLPQPPRDAFGAYVWEVLNLKTTAGRRDAAFMALRRVPALTPDSMKKLGRGKLETIVRLCGPFVDERLSALEIGADVFRRQRGFDDRLQGTLRTAWLALRDLPHLGEAGAVRVLLFASRHPLIPVDTAMTRLAVRLGLVEPTENLTRLARTVRRTLGCALPADGTERRQAALYLAHHAQSTCVEVSPHCGICPIAGACAFNSARQAGAEALSRGPTPL
jgi:endonuclease-3